MEKKKKENKVRRTVGKMLLHCVFQPCCCAEKGEKKEKLGCCIVTIWRNLLLERKTDTIRNTIFFTPCSTFFPLIFFLDE